MQSTNKQARDSRGWKSWARTAAGLGGAFALMLAACGSPQQSEASAPSAPAAATAPVALTGSPALWELKDADTTIYLFGTVHMLKPETVWFDDRIRAAFDRSDELVMEVVESDPAEMAALVGKLAVNMDGAPLSQRLTPAEKERYLKALADNNIPAAAMERLDPWMAAISLSVAPLVRLGYDQNIGVEKTLTRAAQEAGKPIIGLETTEQQLGYFDNLPDKVQIAYLNTTVSELPDVEKEFDALIRSWLDGKPEALAEQLNASMEATPELAQRLLFDRNANWTNWIAKRMDQPGTLFIAVGAGHLAGKGSVIDLLGQRHFTVTRVLTREAEK